MKLPKKSAIPGLASEGMTFVYIGVALIIACIIIPRSLAIFLILVYLAFTAWFFRDPERINPDGDDLITSPADGRIVEIERLEKPPYLNAPALKIGIFMSPFNVHVNRAPIGGKVENVIYRQGGYLKADLKEASLLNEHNAVVLRRDDGARVMYVQVSGLVARRIVCYLTQNDVIRRGERVGMIRFGSRVDVYTPVNADITVKIGDNVQAGESVLAKLPCL